MSGGGQEGQTNSLRVSHAMGRARWRSGCAVANGSLATLRTLLARLFGVARATLMMGTLRAALLGCGFVLFALSLRQLTQTADALPIGRFGAELLPTYHAARLLADPSAELWRFLPWAALTLILLVTTIGLLAS